MPKPRLAAGLLAAALAVPALAQAPSGTAERQAAPGARFATGLAAGQVLATRLIGTTVVSTNNESIGDVNDVVLDRGGRVAAAVIGVGGFLGIGEKNVAVPFEALELVAARPGGSGEVATTGSTADAMPDRLMLRITRAELEAAPAFTVSRVNGGGNR